MNFVIVDLEATCWEGGDRSQMEIIEIGAVLLGPDLELTGREFASFVHPVAHPQLSDFCRKLTSIRQEDVDEADYFPEVLARFLAWIGPEPATLCSWGAYDLNQFRQDCARYNLPFPPVLERHLNLKRAYSQLRHSRPLGMAAALKQEKLPLMGTHHRGIDDARNIAKLAQIIIRAGGHLAQPSRKA